jgi:hypothetical protein
VPNLFAIAQSLEKMQKDIAHIASNSKHVKTDIYSSDDRKTEREREEMEKQFAKQNIRREVQ